MSAYLKSIGWIIAALAAFGAWLTQTNPDDAVSNLSKWADRASIQLPETLRSPSVDTWTVYLLGGVSVGLILLLVLGPALRRSLSEGGSVHKQLGPSRDQSPEWAKRIPLLGFIETAKDAGWDVSGEDNLQILDLLDGLVQAGVDGDITFWGREDRSKDASIARSQPLIRIPAEHFKDHRFDILAVQTSSENFQTRMYEQGVVGYQKAYVDIHLNGDEARAWLNGVAATWKGARDARKSKP